MSEVSATQKPQKRARRFTWAGRITRFIKLKLPKTLWSRALLIIVLPILIMQVAITWVFFDRHWETVTAKLAEGLAGDIAWAVSAYQAVPTPLSLERINAEASKNMQLSIVLQPRQDLPKTPSRTNFAVLDRTLTKAFEDQLDSPFWFDTSRYPGVVDIRVKVKGGVLRIIAPKDRAFATTGYIFIFWVLGATIVLTTVAILFIRNQVRAIERLSHAAEAFGRGEEDPNFKPYGATEVRAAAQAFLQMKARIQRHIEQRTTLLASVSHDLRTPLTRLKLELEMMKPDKGRERMKSDVSEMAYMIDEYLAFARGESQETNETVLMSDLIAELSQSLLRSGYQLGVQDDQGPSLNKPISLRPIAIMRALSNLVINGFHHARLVRLSYHQGHNTKTSAEQFIIHIDDDGPGIAADRREDAFKAFNRLDAARNQNIKGVGLGLSIARDIIRGHGGELILEDSPLGGLRATVILPMMPQAL
jgi:two-component system, OmpR family, osmolarity sensor histidine kinase EnvZ